MGDTDRIVEMGKAALPTLENLLLSQRWAETFVGGGRSLPELEKIVIRALEALCAIGARPSEALRSSLLDLEAMDILPLHRFYVCDAQDIAKRIRATAPRSEQEKASDLIDQIHRRVKVGSAILYGLSLGLRSPDFVNALLVAARRADSAQVTAINALASLGTAAASALPVLKELITVWGRPLTAADFAEQAQLLGGLTPEILIRISRKEPLSREVVQAAESAVRRIEEAQKG